MENFRCNLQRVCFQSVFSLCVGAPLPRMDNKRIKKVAKQIEFNMLVSKILVTIFVAFLAIMPLGYWLYFVRGLKTGGRVGCC